MTGETERSPSGWTIDTLAVHHAALRDADLRFQEERDRRYTERFVSHEKEQQVIAAQTKENKMAANEWRDAMKDREAQFVRKGENAWLVGVVIALASLAGLFITLSGHWK